VNRYWISLVLIILAVCSVSCKGDNSPSTPTPKLISPADDATLNYSNTASSWSFDWGDYPYANCYEIDISNNQEKFETKAKVNSSFYQMSSNEIALTGNGNDGWTWKVRAEVDGIWTEWSKERTFKFKLIDNSSKSNGISSNYDNNYYNNYKSPFSSRNTAPTPRNPWSSNYVNPIPEKDPFSPYYSPSIPDPNNPNSRTRYGYPVAPTPTYRSPYDTKQRTDPFSPYRNSPGNPSYQDPWRSNSSGSSGTGRSNYPGSAGTGKSGYPGAPGLR
jgi:hypothetical protein